MRILSPHELQNQFPLSQDSFDFIQKSRRQAIDTLHGKNKKLALLVGPCSIHDPKVALARHRPGRVGDAGAARVAARHADAGRTPAALGRAGATVDEHRHAPA